MKYAPARAKGYIGGMTSRPSPLQDPSNEEEDMEGEHVRLLAEDDPILEDETAQMLPRSVREFMRGEGRASADHLPEATGSTQRKQNGDKDP